MPEVQTISNKTELFSSIRRAAQGENRLQGGEGRDVREAGEGRQLQQQQVHPGEDGRNRPSTARSPPPRPTKLTRAAYEGTGGSPPRAEEAGGLPSVGSTEVTV